MKKLLKIAVFTLCLAALPQAAAIPVQNMSPFSLGAEYYGTTHGHAELYDFDSSAMAAHFLRLHYAPLPFLRLSAGFGGSHLYGTAVKKSARVDIGATGGFGLYLPQLLEFLSLTAGYDGYFLTAAEAYDRNVLKTDSSVYKHREREGQTSAALHAPYLGLIFHAGRFADVEVGGMYRHFTILKRTQINHFPTGFDDMTGAMMQVTVPREEIKDGLSDQVHIYASLTLHERESGAYLSGGVSYALTNQADGSRSEMQNLSFHAQIGLIMRETRGSARGVRYSDTYADLKWRQDSMASRLSQEPGRRPRGHGERRAPQTQTDESGEEADTAIFTAEE